MVAHGRPQRASYLSPHKMGYNVTWDAVGRDVSTAIVTLEYRDGTRWIRAATGPADENGFTAMLPVGFNGDIRWRIDGRRDTYDTWPLRAPQT